MRIRHRIPSIFNLSMVDVLCCALGCVILLWLLNLKDARQRAAEAGETDQALRAARKERDQLRADLDETSRRAAETRALLEAAEKASRDATARLKQALAQRDEAREHLAALTVRSDAAQKDLAHQRKTAQELERKLRDGSQRLAALQEQIDKAEAQGTDTARRADDLSRRLKAANSRIKELSATADLVPTLREEIEATRDKLGTERAAARALEKQIDQQKRVSTEDARRIETLKGANARLERDVATAQRLRAAAENRFAGIELTGRRVVFLVDMSGSMDYVDEIQADPAKWQGVRDTVARIMNSLPELEKFQVVVFAEKASYLLGQDGRWIDYESKTSAERVTKALAAIKPQGGTNMYAALQAAFDLRSAGLDTIYLLSDGLPNLGEGLTVQQAKTLKETAQAEILGKFIRRKLKQVWNRPARDGVRVRINAVGFFYESPDVGAFLWALARENDGSFVGMSKP
jgi:predicted  nucleic acid-binding Zn-ribbon protein